MGEGEFSSMESQDPFNWHFVCSKAINSKWGTSDSREMHSINCGTLFKVPPRHWVISSIIMLLNLLLAQSDVALFSLLQFKIFPICGTQGLGARRQQMVEDGSQNYNWLIDNWWQTWWPTIDFSFSHGVLSWIWGLGFISFVPTLYLATFFV